MSKKTFSCGNCGADVTEEDKKCPNCNFIFIDELNGELEIFSCGNCGADVTEDDEECPNCKYKFNNISNNNKLDNNYKVIAISTIVFIILSIICLLYENFGIFIFFFFIYLIIIFIVGSSINIKNDNEQKAKLLKENDASFVLENIEYNEGIENFICGDNCNIFLQNDRIKFIDLKNKNIAYIKYSQIIVCGVFTDKQIQKQAITKNGNVIGRGIMGDILFGNIGLLLGSMSAVGANQEIIEIDNTKYFIIINYYPKNSKKAKVISFKSDNMKSIFDVFVENVNKNIKKDVINL